MGYLLNGKYHFVEFMESYLSDQGAFERKDSQFRNWITKDGQPGPTGKGGFMAEKGRYHLYVSHACPWANRTTIVRSLKGLEDFIGLSVVNYHIGDYGWTFEEGPGVIPDTVNHKKFVYELYTLADPTYSGDSTVPVLWDKKNGTIVNNESSEIIRMLNTAFDDLGAKPGDYYPQELRAEIDAVNDFVYPNINNGVYKAGFSISQEIYEKEVRAVFDALDTLEARLENKDFLVGDQLTEADIRLFTTLVRFDSAYFGHFKCNIRALREYKNLWRYTRQLYQQDAFKKNVNFEHIKGHYYTSHPDINPNGIVPVGPMIDWSL